MTQTFADRIEKLKSDYTDKYVVAEAARPELRRFEGLTGQVKTVNMSGRALVEFEGNNNIGWFDIELDYLKVVDKPAPPPAAAKEKAAPAKKKPAPKPAAEKGLSPLELARMQGAAKRSGDTGNGPADRKSKTAELLAAARVKVKKGSDAPKTAPAKPAGKMSTADILAAARGDAAAPAAKPQPAASKPTAQAADPKQMSTADIVAAARGKASSAPSAASKPANPAAEPKAAAAQADPKKMSTADILAAARGGAPASTSETPPAAAPAEEPTAASNAQPAADSKPSAAAGPLPTETADVIAWCREHDAK